MNKTGKELGQEYFQQKSKYKRTENGNGLDFSKNSKEAGVARTK